MDTSGTDLPSSLQPTSQKLPDSAVPEPVVRSGVWPTDVSDAEALGSSVGPE